MLERRNAFAINPKCLVAKTGFAGGYHYPKIKGRPGMFQSGRQRTATHTSSGRSRTPFWAAVKAMPSSCRRRAAGRTLGHLAPSRLPAPEGRVNLIEVYFGFHRPYSSSFRGWFGHVEAWGYTEDDNWLFIDPGCPKPASTSAIATTTWWR